MIRRPIYRDRKPPTSNQDEQQPKWLHGLALLGCGVAGAAFYGLFLWVGLGAVIGALAMFFVVSAVIVSTALGAGSSRLGAFGWLLGSLVLLVPAFFISTITVGRLLGRVMAGAHSAMTPMYVLIGVVIETVPIWAALLVVGHFLRRRHGNSTAKPGELPISLTHDGLDYD